MVVDNAYVVWFIQMSHGYPKLDSLILKSECYVSFEWLTRCKQWRGFCEITSDVLTVIFWTEFQKFVQKEIWKSYQTYSTFEFGLYWKSLLKSTVQSESEKCVPVPDLLKSGVPHINLTTEPFHTWKIFCRTSNKYIRIET